MLLHFDLNVCSAAWNEKDLDLICAPLVMTAERDEVIDFIIPYIEQTGISIGTRDITLKNINNVKILMCSFEAASFGDVAVQVHDGVQVGGVDRVAGVGHALQLADVCAGEIFAVQLHQEPRPLPLPVQVRGKALSIVALLLR